MLDGKRALVVQPGDTRPAPRTPEKHALQLESILVTHHHVHSDAGIDELREVTGASVPGAVAGRISQPQYPRADSHITAFAAIRQWKNQFK
ncbi:MAG: hypothetical protein ABI845_11530 [Polaromonas sp.]